MNLCRLKDEGKEETLTSGQISIPEEGSITKKRVSWKENLTISVPIEGKVKISKDMQEEVLAMICVFKQFIPIQMKRTRFVELNQLVSNYERFSQKI